MIRPSSLLFVVCCCITPAYASGPSAQAVEAFNAARVSDQQLDELYEKILHLARQPEPDKVEGPKLGAELVDTLARRDRQLAEASALGHAGAMFMKAHWDILRDKKNKPQVCELYGKAAALGLMAAAVEYVRCDTDLKRLQMALQKKMSPELRSRLDLLQQAIEGDDPYLADYPMLAYHLWCFPKHRPPLKDGPERMQMLMRRGLKLSAPKIFAQRVTTRWEWK